VYGSIHSFKGRECKRGILYLDSGLRCSSAEEFRVFYVGITRPISNLEIVEIKSQYYEYDKYNKRAFNRSTLEIEIGLEGDIVWSIDAKDYGSTPFGAHQKWLRENCCNIIELEAILTNDKSNEPRYDVITKQSGRYIGNFSKWLVRKIYFSYRNCGSMPNRFSNIFMLGTESVDLARFVPSEADEELTEQILLRLGEHAPKVFLSPIILGIAKATF